MAQLESIQNIIIWLKLEVRRVYVCLIIRSKLKCYTDGNSSILNNAAGGMTIVSKIYRSFLSSLSLSYTHDNSFVPLTEQQKKTEKNAVQPFSSSLQTNENDLYFTR